MPVLYIRDEDGNFIPIPSIMGKTPVRGEDYWTEEDQQQIINDVLGQVGGGGDGSAIIIDTTLTKSGAAADAEVVGTKIKEINQTHEQILVYGEASGYNLLNPAECAEDTYLRYDTGAVETYAGRLTTGYMPVEAGKTYVATWLSGNVRATRWTQIYAFYDAGKNYISGVSGGRTFLAPDNAAYLRACWYVSDTSMTVQSIIDTKTMIGEGTDATHEYEEYITSAPRVKTEALQPDLLSEMKAESVIIERMLGGYNPYRDGMVRKIAHRGISSGIPENTLPAFDEAVKKGYHYIETDVQHTSDGIPVLWHDDDLTAVGHAGESVADHTLEEIKSMRFTAYADTEYADTAVPSMEEALVFFRANGINPYIEIKRSTTTSEQIETLYNLVHQYGMIYASTWISAMWDKLAVLVGLNPKLVLSYVSGMTGNVDTLIANAKNIKTSTNIVNISLYKGLLTDDGCKAIKDAGYGVETWTLAEGEMPAESLVKYIDAYTIDVAK